MNITIEDKINIEDIDDNRRYGVLSMLVDQEDYIKEIKSIRQSLNLPLPINYPEVRSFFNKQTEKWRMSFNLRISLLHEQFGRGDNYRKVFKYSVLAGEVRTRDFKNSAFCAIYPFEDIYGLPEEEVVDYPTVAVFIHPETSMEEVKRLLEEDAKKLFLEIDKRHVPDKASHTVKEMRELYWLKKTGNKTYMALADKLGKGYTPENIKKSIKRYENKYLVGH
jgi:hypothetical protein